MSSEIAPQGDGKDDKPKETQDRPNKPLIDIKDSGEVPVVLPPDEVEQIAEIVIQQVKSQRYSGPIPPPRMLREYEEIVPGSAKLIIDNFAAQSKHRQTLEATHQWHNNLRSWAGWGTGTVTTLAGIALAAFMVHKGYPGWAVAVVFFEISGLTTTFVVGKYQNSAALLQKWFGANTAPKADSKEISKPDRSQDS